MWEASDKAEAASKEYNKLVSELEEAEQQSWAAEIYGKDVIDLRSSMKSDTYRPLKSAYNRYQFWKGEVERLSSLLVGEEAYHHIYTRNSQGTGGI